MYWVSRARRGMRIEDTRQGTEVGSFRVRGLHKAIWPFICRTSEDPIENALLCLFSFWLFGPAESRVEWRRERETDEKKKEVCRGSERRREAGRGERGALGVWGNESDGCIGPQTFSPFVFTAWSGCVPLVIFFKWQIVCASCMCSWPLPFTKAVVCCMWIQLPRWQRVNVLFWLLPSKH